MIMNIIPDILRVALPCLLLSATAAGQRHTFSVNGKVGHLAPPAKAYLSYEGLDGYQNDSAAISDGRFSFSGEVLRLRRARLWINPVGDGPGRGWGHPIDLYLEATPISIQSEDSLKNLVLSGGPVITDLVAYQKAAEAARLQTPGKSEVPKEELARARYYDSVTKKEKVIALQFISQHTDSDYSLLLLKEQAGMTPDTKTTEAVFNTLSARVRTSAAGAAYTTFLNEMKVRDAGTVAPDFTMPDTSGRQVSLHDFKGRYVFLDFWASWCTPCRAENPNVAKAYAAYKHKGLEIISISIDDAKDREKWVEAIKADRLTWIQLCSLDGWENNTVAKAYEVKWVPMNYLVGPDGKIVARNLRGYDLQARLAELMGGQ
jgi:peroxiredoxin